MKTEPKAKGGLSKDYVHQEGRFIVNRMLYLQSSVLNKISKPRRTEIDEQVQRLCNKARFESKIVAYNAQRESNGANSQNKDKANTIAKAAKHVSEEISQNFSHVKPIERHNQANSSDLPIQ